MQLTSPHADFESITQILPLGAIGASYLTGVSLDTVYEDAR
jgi:hypothetical protein